MENLTSIRRAQLISTYGIGSLLPVEHESFIVMGQNSWPPKWINKYHNGKRSNAIHADELATALGVKDLIPPPAEDIFQIPVRRFPEMYACPICKRLDFWTDLARDSSTYGKMNICVDCKTENATLIPSRFVAVCKDGHIQDFPYYSWVHRGSSGDCTPRESKLSLHTQATHDSLQGLIIKCTCGAKRSMEGALGRARLGNCRGRYPWLDDKEPANCDKELIGLQRGAANVWQSIIHSAITVPGSSEAGPIASFLNENPWMLALPPERRDKFILDEAQNNGFEPEELSRAVEQRTSSSPNVESLKELRSREYKALQTELLDQGGNSEFLSLPKVADSDFKDRTKVSLVSDIARLREVRVLSGFYRVELSEENSWQSTALLSNRKEDWLPAIEAWGEGVFFKLDEQLVSDWETRPWPNQRFERILSISQNPRALKASVRMVLLHSLAHILINQLSLVAGYTAASIRERLYADDDQCGVLLYTAGSDSAGSLGGLSALSSLPKAEEILLGALETARWCSADPVCIESGLRGLDSMNLAACHYCMLVPEVSCEHNNVLLDRAMLIGTPDDPSKGFFSDLFEIDILDR
ncbi:DUF1998 domain-containing protein [Corynebacterium aquatimens]|uniref:MrfA-like Zn-binding domain-containing protein n=1 Tax=Corynebacterium aquatimens TaxID=1190508 RepID=A0A931DTT2_9CORY|nr:DUF1998 domain-containing protein [Corynebacterium aquatimens]MBG6121314.1 hypothetical protein [Corynebacterium aquatimens]